MPLRAVAGGGNVGTITYPATILTSWRAVAKVGDIVQMDPSADMLVNSAATDQSPTAIPMGEVTSIEKGSVVCTVEWWNVRAFVTKRYSTVGTRGSNIIGAADTSTITGSATFGVQDNTYICAIDTGNQTMTFAIL